MTGRSTRGAALAALPIAGSLTLAACSPQPIDAALEHRESALLGAGSLLATATLDRPTDFAGLTDTIENGLPQNVLGGIGSGLTWAGGTTFLAVPTPSALANGRSVATQTYRASKGGVAAFCTRYAREVVSRQP